MRRNLETLILILVGLAIVAGLAWLTTRALEPLLGGDAEATPAAATLEPTTIAVATARPRPTPTLAHAKPTPIPRPTRPPAPRPSAVVEPSPRPRPTAPAPRREPEARRSPASTERWSAAREYRVESAAKLHEAADSSAHVIARLRPGTIVTVVAERDGWRRIESSLGQRAGWIESRHLRPVR